MSDSFFFYDLETSGVNPRNGRIMQFAGQRTDMNLKPLGEPVNVLIKLTEDILPDPDAVLVHGTTPQQTLAEGMTEAEFVKMFNSEILKPNTVFVGFNNIRFDDEFMRFLFYRNFNDAYQWQWQDGCSRWDLLDVARMTRALRPKGIQWPFDSEGKPSNRLELLSNVNKLDHADAHDALSDVNATIAVAKLIKQKQPKLFDYLLSMRNKRKIQSFVEQAETFVYSSGKYPAEFEKTAVVTAISPHPDKNGALVYDLRVDPAEFLDMPAEQLAERWKYDKESEETRLPVKSLQYNRCPAVAPTSVLDHDSKKRLTIDDTKIKEHLNVLRSAKEFKGNLLKAVEIINAARGEQPGLLSDGTDVDQRLYDSFLPDKDRSLSTKLREAKPGDISGFAERFSDERLKNLVKLYKARNFHGSLTEEELKEWEDYRRKVLLSGGKSSRLAKYASRLEELSKATRLNEEKRYLLEELQLWAENIVPEVD